jgi:hypothetical protein
MMPGVNLGHRGAGMGLWVGNYQSNPPDLQLTPIKEISVEKKVLPFFEAICTSCHGN